MSRKTQPNKKCDTGAANISYFMSANIDYLGVVSL